YPRELYCDVGALANDLGGLARYLRADEAEHLADLALWADQDGRERFEYAFTLAHTRYDLMQLVHGNAETLRQFDDAVTKANLLATIDAALANPYRRRKLIPAGISSVDAYKLAELVVSDYFSGALLK